MPADRQLTPSSSPDVELDTAGGVVIRVTPAPIRINPMEFAPLVGDGRDDDVPTGDVEEYVEKTFDELQKLSDAQLEQEVKRFRSAIRASGERPRPRLAVARATPRPPTVPAPAIGTRLRPRSTPRAPSSRRASSTRNHSPPGRKPSCPDDPDLDPEHLVADVALLNALCCGALERDDSDWVFDAASGAFAAIPSSAWVHADLDRLCPRCLSPWTIHPRSGQRWCDWCWLRTTLELSQRRKSA